MCGIIGYLGTRSSLPILVEGLRRMEYRGYDSTGIAVLNGPRVLVRKRAGKLSELDALLDQDLTHGNGDAASLMGGTAGLGHTRWATHGAPTDLNAHPHVDCTGSIAVIHNGIIENFDTLKRMLL